VGKNVTLNYGLRYELNTVCTKRTEAEQFPARRTSLNISIQVIQLFRSNLDGLACLGCGPSTDVGLIYDPDHNNFAPRIGLAWDLFSNGKRCCAQDMDVLRTIIAHSRQRHAESAILARFFNPFPGWPDAFAPSGFPVLTVTQPALVTPMPAFQFFDAAGIAARTLLEDRYVGTLGTKTAAHSSNHNRAFITRPRSITLDVGRMRGRPTSDRQFHLPKMELGDSQCGAGHPFLAMPSLSGRRHNPVLTTAACR